MNGITEAYDEMLDQYENLILQRDRLEKEAELYRLDYYREFGELIRDAFQAKIDCIALKKSISFCQEKINAGREIDPLSMQECIDKGIRAYKEQLNDLLRIIDAGKSLEPISVLDAEEIKRIYRRVAKRLHPDICPLTEENPELMELFRKVLSAYRSNNLKAIREAETLINRFLKELGENLTSYEIKDLPEKITDLENEISRIIDTIPYSYKLLLENAEAVEKKRNEFEDEKEKYLNYKDELQAHLNNLLTE